MKKGAGDKNSVTDKAYQIIEPFATFDESGPPDTIRICLFIPDLNKCKASVDIKGRFISCGFKCCKNN